MARVANARVAAYRRARPYRGRNRPIVVTGYGRSRYRKSQITRTPSVFRFARNCDLTAASTLITVVGTQNAGPNSQLLTDGMILASGVGGNPQYYSYALQISLQSLNNYAEFTNLFDSYKIEGFKLKLIPFATNTVANDSTGTALAFNTPVSGMIANCIDYDDATPFPATAAGMNAMREYSSYKIRNLQKGLYIKGKPKAAMALFLAGSAFTSYAQAPKNVWIDCDNNVTHYHSKFMIEIFNPSTTANAFIWLKPELKVYFKTKDLR